MSKDNKRDYSSNQVISQFDFEDFDVRIVGKDGSPWFVAKDVCKVLGISKYRDACSKLDDDERGSVKLDTLGGPQNLLIISESGLFYLLGRSNKPKAKEFSRWVRKVVLPSIRKDGWYAPGKSKMEMIAEAFAVMAETERRILEHDSKIRYHDRVLESHGDELENIRLERAEMTKQLQSADVPEVEVKEKTERAKLNQFVRASCFAMNMPHNEAWRRIYVEYKYRYGVDLVSRAKNRGRKPLDIAEELDHIETLHRIGFEVFESMGMVDKTIRHLAVASKEDK